MPSAPSFDLLHPHTETASSDWTEHGRPSTSKMTKIHPSDISTTKWYKIQWHGTGSKWRFKNRLLSLESEPSHRVVPSSLLPHSPSAIWKGVYKSPGLACLSEKVARSSPLGVGILHCTSSTRLLMDNGRAHFHLSFRAGRNYLSTRDQLHWHKEQTQLPSFVWRQEQLWEHRTEDGVSFAPELHSCPETHMGDITSRTKAFHYAVQGLHPFNENILTIMSRSIQIIRQQ